MFERYTEPARRSIFFARYEASQFGSSHIDAEHLLLGILREDYTLASHLLASPKTALAIRTQLLEKSPQAPKVSTTVDMPLSLAAQQVLTRAAEIADSLGHSSIAPIHLLMGILKDEESVATEIMKAHGVTAPRVQQALAAPPAETPLLDSARQAVEAAIQQVFQKGCAEVEPQHLLIPLLNADPQLTARLLGDASDSISTIQQAVDALPNAEPTELIPTTSFATQQVLAYAAAEARRLGHQSIAPVHLLLGILDDEESLATEVLNAHGITRDKVRAALS